jgi:hypothetical protein
MRAARGPARDATCRYVDRSQMQFMGYSLRVPEWRYTEWRRWNARELQADWSEAGLVGVELCVCVKRNAAAGGVVVAVLGLLGLSPRVGIN